MHPFSSKQLLTSRRRPHQPLLEYRLMYLLTHPTQDREVNLPTFHIIKVIHIMYFSFTTPSPSLTRVLPCHQLLSFHLIYSVSNHWAKSSIFEKTWSSHRHLLSTRFLRRQHFQLSFKRDYFLQSTEFIHAWEWKKLPFSIHSKWLWH